MGSIGDLQRKFYDSIDTASNSIITISEPHSLIHTGNMFQVSGKQTGWLTATEKKFLIDVPASTFPHVQVMDLTFGRGDIDFVAYEGATTSDDGSALTPQNPNRNSTNTPDTLLYGEPTITDPGTIIFTMWTPPTSTGTGQSGSGISGEGQGHEWVLKPSTKYYILLTNNSGATISWSYEFMWYEI